MGSVRLKADYIEFNIGTYGLFKKTKENYNVD